MSERLSEERALSEREGSQRERGAMRAGRSELARTGLSEERALSEREGSQRERGATRAGRSELARTGLSEERAQSVENILVDARSGLRRLDPNEAAAAQAGGAILVDTRPYAFRVVEGEIPGALVVERNVLEWRFAPDSDWRLPEAGPDTVVVVVCNEGYASSLAADSLRRLGVRNATDLDGGFRAWAAAGLPTVPGGSSALP
jgi:rhodanese-related sulfurtransferase